MHERAWRNASSPHHWSIAKATFSGSASARCGIVPCAHAGRMRVARDASDVPGDHSNQLPGHSLPLPDCREFRSPIRSHACLSAWRTHRARVSFFGDSFVYVIFEMEQICIGRARGPGVPEPGAISPAGNRQDHLGPDATRRGLIYEYALVDKAAVRSWPVARPPDWFLKFELKTCPTWPRSPARRHGPAVPGGARSTKACGYGHSPQGHRRHTGR